MSAYDEAVEALAKGLFRRMEQLDPSEEFDWRRTTEENWTRLGHNQRFYIHIVRDLISREREIRIALGDIPL